MARSRSIRPARVASVVRETLAEALAFQVKDPRLHGVTISDVEITGDLQEARVFVYVDGGEGEAEEALASLERASGFLRHLIGERVRLRVTPRLNFFYDHSLEYGARIESKLAELGLGHDDAVEPPEGVDADADPEER